MFFRIHPKTQCRSGSRAAINTGKCVNVCKNLRPPIRIRISNTGTDPGDKLNADPEPKHRLQLRKKYFFLLQPSALEIPFFKSDFPSDVVILYINCAHKLLPCYFSSRCINQYRYRTYIFFFNLSMIYSSLANFSQLCLPSFFYYSYLYQLHFDA